MILYAAVHQLDVEVPLASSIQSIVRVVGSIVVVCYFGSGVAAAQSADLRIDKFTFDDPAPTDSLLTYFLDVFNDGPDAAQDVVVTDVLPPDVTFVSVSSFPGGVACTDRKSTRLNSSHSQ